MKRLLVLGVALAVLLLAACGPSYSPGPDGTVTGKRTTVSCRTVGKQRQCRNPRYLTTETASGARTEFRVNADTYSSCTRGSNYPKCTTR